MSSGETPVCRIPGGELIPIGLLSAEGIPYTALGDDSSFLVFPYLVFSVTVEGTDTDESDSLLQPSGTAVVDSCSNQCSPGSCKNCGLIGVYMTTEEAYRLEHNPIYESLHDPLEKVMFVEASHEFAEALFHGGGPHFVIATARVVVDVSMHAAVSAAVNGLISLEKTRWEVAGTHMAVAVFGYDPCVQKRCWPWRPWKKFWDWGDPVTKEFIQKSGPYSLRASSADIDKAIQKGLEWCQKCQ